MKKSVFIMLVFALCMTCLPMQSVKAKALYEYHTYVLTDHQSKILLTLYDYDETIMIRIKDLVNLTGYEVSQQKDTLTFTKNEKQVVIKGQMISYGAIKEEIKVVSVDDETYVSLLPTIDYLDSRIQFVDQHFILKKGDVRFLDVVKKMNQDLDEEYLLLSNHANINHDVVDLWNIFAANKVDTLPDRIKESVLTTLLFEFELTQDQLLDMIHDADQEFYTNTTKEERIKQLKAWYGKSLATYMDEEDIDSGVEKGLLYYATIHQYYRKNMKNALLGITSLYGSSSSEVKMMKNQMKLLDQHEKESKVLDAFLNQAIYDDEEKLVDFVLSESSLFSQGVKASTYFASKVNFYNAQDLQSYKQAYLGLQAKAIEACSKAHAKMMHKMLTKKDMQTYAYQVRLYDQLAICYSTFIEVPLGAKEEDAIIHTRNYMYQYDDLLKDSTFYYEDLDYQPSNVAYEDLKDGFVEPVDVNDIHLLDVFWTIDSMKPTYFKFLSNGKYDVYSGFFKQSYEYSGHYQLQGLTLYLDGVPLEYMKTFDTRIDRDMVKGLSDDPTACIFYETGWTKDDDETSYPLYLMKSSKEPTIAHGSETSDVYEYMKDDFLVQCTKKDGFFSTKVSLSLKNGYGNGDYQKQLEFTLSDDQELYEVLDSKDQTTYYIECFFEEDGVHLRMVSDGEPDAYLALLKEGILLTNVNEG